MIRIEQENDQKLFIPKNVEGEPELLQIHSELTQKTISFDVSDLGTSSRYYNFTINAINVPEGEYNYTVISDEGVELAIGLLTIGDPDTNLVIIQYGDGNINYVQYYPNQKSHISLETDLHLSETADSISYTVQANRNWIFQLYSRHHTSSTWQLIAEESHTESTYDGSYFIGENVEDYPKHFKIVVTTTDGLAQEQAEIYQDPHYYMTVDVFSSSSAIPASATELSYGIQYSEYNSVHTGTFFIYRNNELIREQPFGVYHYGYSTYMEISANTTDQPVTYRIYGVLDNGQNDTFEVVQAAVEPYKSKRFTFEMLEDGIISWDGIAYYDIIRNGVRDAGYQMDHSTNELLAGDLVEFYLRGDYSGSQAHPFSSTGKHNVYGNVMSLYYADFSGVTACDRADQFRTLFTGDNNLVNAENLILPATALTNNCYLRMFSTCTSLETAPELPATTLAYGCYYGMFEVCTSLETAPELPATTLAEMCYYNMFNGCTNLSKAPDLPSLQLALGCYSAMFVNCTSLTEAPELPATTLANSCYANMFDGCTSLTTAPALPSQSPVMECYSAMFARCTSLTTAPELPADNMVRECYEYMFNGCTNLNYIKCLASYDVGLNGSTSNWVKDVSSSGTFVMKAQSFGWEVGDSGIPEGWTTIEID